MRLSKTEVTIHLRSGARLRFLCEEVTKTYRGNDLEGLKATDTEGWPFYFRLEAVDAVTTRKVPFWARPS